MKNIFVLILVVVSALFLIGCTTEAPVIQSDDLSEQKIVGVEKPINVAESELIFTGRAVGKSHDGTFDDWSGSLFFENGQIVGAEGVIQATSVNTGIDGLDNHLRNEDFFNVEIYPEIKITSHEFVQKDGMTYAISRLTFLGITKEVEFPISLTENSLSGEFDLDLTEFGIKHIGTNKIVSFKLNMIV